jgi:hypothetical protein
MAPDAALPDAALVVDALQAVAVDAALPVDAAPAVDAPQLPDAPPPMSPKVTFTIRSEPSGATVKIVGKVGKTPYEVTLDRSLGVVDYNIELSGYFPRKDRINLTLRELTVPTYQLDKKRSGGGGGGSGRPNRPKNPGDGSGSNKPGSDTDLMRP